MYSMTSKIARYLVYIAAILLFIASLLYFLMLGTVLLLIVAAMAQTTFNYNPGAIPFLLGGAGIFLFYGFFQLTRWRATPQDHRIVFIIIGIISLVIGILYFVIPIGPLGPPPFINRNAPGPILMFSLPITAGILTIITPFLKGRNAA